MLFIAGKESILETKPVFSIIFLKTITFPIEKFKEHFLNAQVSFEILSLLRL